MDKYKTYQFLKKKGFPEKDMIAAGLIKQTSNSTRGGENYYDVFRGRLMFPIFDQYSRVVGFGGRILQDVKDQPKYINTPRTEAYDKSSVLYGLDKAKDSIRGAQQVVIVEGYMDVIASHQADVKNVVSVSGTALTDGHFQLIKRFTNNATLAFDMDAAGTAAAIRTYQLAGNHQVNIKVVQLPEGKDPDDLIRLEPKKWQQAISTSRHIIDYCFEVVWQDLDISKLEDKKKVRDNILPLIMSITDSVEKNHFLEKLAVLLKVSVEELIREGQKFRQAQTSHRPGIVLNQRMPEPKEFIDRKSTRLNSSHIPLSRMPSSA